MEKQLNPVVSDPAEASAADEQMDFDQSIRDPQRGKRFALYIDHLPGKDRLISALAGYKKGEYTERDLIGLQAAFETFEKKEGTGEASFKTIEEWQTDVLENSAVFTRFIKFKRLGDIQRVLEKGLPDLALKDPRAFKAIQTEIEKLNEFAIRDGKASEIIRTFCENEGITEDAKVLDALKHVSVSDRTAAVRTMLKAHIRQRDGWRSFYDFGVKAAAADLSSRVNLGQLINERKQVSKEFGDYLRTFLVTNRDFRTALSRAHDESQPTFKEGSEAKLSFGEAQTESEQLSKAVSLRRAKEYRRANDKEFREAKRRATAGDPSMLTDLQNDFYGGEENRQLKYEKQGGVFARVFIAILGALFDVKADPDIKKELS